MPLHPKAKEFLDILAAKNGPSWEELGAVEGRKFFASLLELFGEGPELHRVTDRMINDGVAVRVYTPARAEALPVLIYFHGGGFVIPMTRFADG